MLVSRAKPRLCWSCGDFRSLGLNGHGCRNKKASRWWAARWNTRGSQWDTTRVDPSRS
jgi:hypothetical protein